MAKALRAGFQRLLHRCWPRPAADGEVQTLHRRLLGREVTASTHASAQPGVHALDRVGAVQDFADLGVVGEEGHELGPGVVPQADDRRVAVAPFVGELVEALPGGLLGGGGVDGAQVAGELVPVLLARIAEGVAHQVQDAGLDDRERPDVGHRFDQAAEAVADEDAHVLDATVADLAEHLVPVLGALTTVPDPEPEDLPHPLDGDADDGVDRPVGDLAVTDLDLDRIDEDHRVDLVEWPALPGDHLLDHPVGDPRDRVPRDLRAVHVGEVSGDLAGRQAFRGQRDHQLIDARQPALALLDDLRLERPLAISGDVDLDLADLGQHRLRTRAVARVALVAARRRMLRIAEVVLHLHLQRRLQNRLRQIGQQTARTDQLNALAARPLNQLLSDLLVRRRLHSRGHLLRHYELPSAGHPAGKSGPRSYTVNRTVPRRWKPPPVSQIGFLTKRDIGCKLRGDRAEGGRWPSRIPWP